nr:MerR family transcriptional regulator [Streptomyces sp. SM11]
MHSSFLPPRRIKIGDVAAFAGSTPRAIRHYHEIGLLPEPERGGDDRRRYGYEDLIRLLWIRRTADDGEDEADPGSGRREADSMSALDAIGKMPYDFSPARLRCMELAEELAAHDVPGT